MLEEEYNELNKYTIEASRAVADYHDRLDDLSDKDKLYVVEKILAKLDIILIFTMNIRHQILEQMKSMPATVRVACSQALNELKTTMETAKTLSFNFTAVYHATRDKTKVTLE